MKNFLETHFTLIMCIALALGLVVPGADHVDSSIVTSLLAVLIFLSCFKITPADIKRVSLSQGLLFYVFRFLLIPLATYGLFLVFMPSYAVSVLLFSLMPTGTAAPAVTNLINGNIALALFVVCLSSILAPLAVPGAFILFGNDSLSIDPTSLFHTLAVVIFAPIAAYLVLKKSSWLNRQVEHYNQSASTLIVAVIILLVVASSRELMIAEPSTIMSSLLILFALFSLFYLFGWNFERNNIQIRERATMAACSGVNNNALGAGLALIHFSPEVALFMALSEVPWVIGISLLKKNVT
ncbi:hypothetical protein MRY87_04895 [bacterium]|nr:hypothetical protein [bacterium]